MRDTVALVLFVVLALLFSSALEKSEAIPAGTGWLAFWAVVIAAIALSFASETLRRARNPEQVSKESVRVTGSCLLILIVIFSPVAMLFFAAAEVSMRYLIGAVFLLLLFGAISLVRINNRSDQEEKQLGDKRRTDDRKRRRNDLIKSLGGTPSFIQDATVSGGFGYHRCFYGIRGNTLCFGEPIHFRLNLNEITKYAVFTVGDEPEEYRVEVTTKDLRHPMEQITFINRREMDIFVARLDIWTS